MELDMAKELLRWIILGVGINAAALLMIMVSILVLGMHLNKGLQAISVSNERISATTERIAQMTAQVLREVRRTD